MAAERNTRQSLLVFRLSCHKPPTPPPHPHTFLIQDDVTMKPRPVSQIQDSASPFCAILRSPAPGLSVNTEPHGKYPLASFFLIISFVGGLKLGFHLHQQSSEVEGKQWRMFFGGGCQLQKNPR
ncbi:hypothetical protein JZ751_013510 [Albula glossodonta]|uniref:Uncharacterized protein n=1 Tax=Albula glossodonta TaxID=121402 RepID=A0A8T2MZS3_9TELE|nr:hypothetical protein JZ751_013510 [Albula glossodonta]